jgi:hypothetical protein
LVHIIFLGPLIVSSSSSPSPSPSSSLSGWWFSTHAYLTFFLLCFFCYVILLYLTICVNSIELYCHYIQGKFYLLIIFILTVRLHLMWCVSTISFLRISFCGLSLNVSSLPFVFFLCNRSYGCCASTVMLKNSVELLCRVLKALDYILPPGNFRYPVTVSISQSASRICTSPEVVCNESVVVYFLRRLKNNNLLILSSRSSPN